MSKGHHYIVCSVPRSGSSFFCETLRATGALGRPVEYFSRSNERTYRSRLGAASVRDYVQKLVAEMTAFGSVFGAKIMYRDLERLLAGLRSEAALPEARDRDLLEAAIPGVRMIWLTRRNKIRQAVSFVRARQTQSWAWHDEPVAAPRYDYALLDSALSELEGQEARWRSFFSRNHIAPLVVVHEDFVSRAVEAVEHVLEFLEIPHQALPGAQEAWTLRQSDTLSEEWARRFEEERSNRSTDNAT